MPVERYGLSHGDENKAELSFILGAVNSSGG